MNIIFFYSQRKSIFKFKKGVVESEYPPVYMNIKLAMKTVDN